MNAENVARSLDTLIASLQSVREMVSRHDDEALEEYLHQARVSREEWLDQRRSANWQTEATITAPSAGDMLGRLVGLRPKKDGGKRR